MHKEKKTIVISGSSKGVGFEIARQFNKDDNDLILIARNFHKNFKKEFRNPGSISLIKKGIDDKFIIDEIDSVIHKKKLNFPNIIINNSGGPDPKKPGEITEDEFKNYIEVGLIGFIRVMKKYTPIMRKNKWGRIINIGSTVSKEPSPIMATSASVRSALNAYSKSLSIDLADAGITVNTINLGGVLTDRIKYLFSKIADETGVSVEEKIREAESSIPMKRFAEPIEVAYLVDFLCSKKANYITGQVISIDGGLSKSL